MPHDARDNPSQAFTITNWTEDLDMDCDNCADACIADVLGTLINELQKQGIIKGTTAT